MRRRQSRGFTLLEIMMVVVIVALLGMVAIFSFLGSADVLNVESAAAVLKSRIERAQALASVAGSRVGTTRLVLAAACHHEPGPPQLWIAVDAAAGKVTVPASISLRDDSDEALVECEVFDLDKRSHHLATFVFAPASAFAFTPDGRVIQANGTNESVFMSIKQSTNDRTLGWRILASGVLCAATSPTQNTCDEDA